MGDVAAKLESLHTESATKRARTLACKVNVTDMLRSVRSKGGAIGAFNIYNIEGALAVARAAETAGEPVILQLHPASMSFGGTALIAACRDIASKTAVPIAIQLDHASDENAIVAALDAGVDAVMADGSHLPLEENTQWTAKMAELAHSYGATVEAELGKLAGEEDGLSVSEKEAKMTDPDVVAKFLKATQVDALAVTIGNVHGKYATANPQLDFPRLERVRAAAGGEGSAGIPLVLHGASGLPEATVREAIDRGICKFNVNTEVRAAAKNAIKDGCAKKLDLLDLMKASAEAMTPVIADKISLFKPRGSTNGV